MVNFLINVLAVIGLMASFSSFYLVVLALKRRLSGSNTIEDFTRFAVQLDDHDFKSMVDGLVELREAYKEHEKGCDNHSE